MSPKPHLLFTAPSAYPLGGVATWLDYVVPGLRRTGWDVTLGLVEGKFHDVDAYLAVHPDPQVLRIPYGTGTSEGRVRQLVRAICGVCPDVVVSVNIGDAAPALAHIRSRSELSPPLVITLHGIQADLMASIADWAHIIDGVICTNRLTCELVAKMSAIEADRIYYAPYGVDMPCSMLRERTESSVKPLRIAYVGRLERPQKRIEDLSAIAGELDRRKIDYELVIAGAGPDEIWLQEQLSDATAAGRVRFVGTLFGRELAEQVYLATDVFLITSLWETGPIVAWEAMAHWTGGGDERVSRIGPREQPKIGRELSDISNRGCGHRRGSPRGAGELAAACGPTSGRHFSGQLPLFHSGLGRRMGFHA